MTATEEKAKIHDILKDFSTAMFITVGPNLTISQAASTVSKTYQRRRRIIAACTPGKAAPNRISGIRVR